MVTAKQQALFDEHRELWADIAQKHGWYHEPFFVHLWINGDGEAMDSVSYNGLERDIVEVYEPFD